MQRMKILHILDEIRYSGAEVMLKNSAHLFKDNNIELFALSTGKDIGVYSDKLIEAGFKIYHIPFRKTLQFFKEIYKLLFTEKFEIVHIHAERAFFWYSVTAKLAGIKKIVRTVHSLYTFRGYLKLKRKLQRFVSSKFIGVKFISISSSVQKTEKEYFNNSTILIKNWIDDLNLKPARDISEKLNVRKNWGLSEDQIVIISVGNCSEIKNHSDIIRAIAELAPHDKNIIYLHIGEGEKAFMEVNLAHNLGIDNYVKFVGKVDNVRELLICSDIFVMSSYFEGIGVAALEAGSCGLPIVIYDSPGLKESVQNGYNGFITKQNFKDLSEGIKKLILNEKLRIILGKNSIKFVEENFNMADSVNKLINLYFA